MTEPVSPRPTEPVPPPRARWAARLLRRLPARLARRAERSRLRMHGYDLVIFAAVAILAVLAYLRDPSLPAAGFRTGGKLFLDILPRLLGAVILTGLLQVLVAPEWIQQWLGRGAGHRGILVAFVAGVLTPGGPLVSFPLMAVFYKSGASLSALVCYVTSWSLFGFQRILAWELPFMGTTFLLARVLPSLAFPIVAGYLVRYFYED